MLALALVGCSGAHVAGVAPQGAATGGTATEGAAASDGAGGDVGVVPPATATPVRFATGMDARATDGKWLYGFAFDGDAIVRVGPFGGTPTLVVATAPRNDDRAAGVYVQARWWTLAADAEAVYWSDFDGGSRSRIWRAPSGGGTAQLLADVQAGFPLELVLHGSHLYYSDGGLVEMSVAGDARRLVTAGAGTPISVDDDNAWVVRDGSYHTVVVDRVSLDDGTRTAVGSWTAGDEWPSYWVANDEALYAFSALGEVHRVDRMSGAVTLIAGGPDETRLIASAVPMGAAVADGTLYWDSLYTNGVPYNPPAPRYLTAMPTSGMGGRALVQSLGADSPGGALVVWGDSVYYTGGGGVWRVAR